jgi:hypothetical protein
MSMISRPIVRFSLLILTLGLTFEAIAIKPAIAEKKDEAVYEDNLNTTDGLKWGGPKLPYRKVVDIRDSLVSTPLGKVTADRHGTGATINLWDSISGTFSYPVPGRSVYISLWGSKLEGCFAEIVLQSASNTNSLEENALIPKLLEIGIGSQLLELPPQAGSQPKVLNQNYIYYGADLKTPSNGIWYMTRNTFVVDASIANILRSAPATEARARLTLADGQKVLIPISKATVASWKDAYGFNPTCQNPTVAARQQQLANKPLLKAFSEYTGTPAQDAAFDWLEKQIQPATLLEFAKRWRGGVASGKSQSIRLVSAGKFYKHLPSQEEALEWLQGQLTPTASALFAKKWN